MTEINTASDTDPAPQKLNELVARRSSADVMLAFYDSLPAVQVDDMLGLWKGQGVETGNPFDGVLETMGWYGKRFDGPDDVDPLVMIDGKGKLFYLNPAFAPMSLTVRFSGLFHNPIVIRLFRLITKLFRTTAPKARLRMTEHRGALTATMCYDSQAVHDVFRKVDDNTVLGLMDARALSEPLFFVLRRAEVPSV
jgi:Domain of unknown function (DUF4334)/GXWXG protein